MKLLAKSAIDPVQTDVRKKLPVDGIEIIFLGPEIDNYERTMGYFLRLAEHFPVIGIEAAMTMGNLPVNPVSGQPAIAQPSQDYLRRGIALASELVE